MAVWAGAMSFVNIIFYLNVGEFFLSREFWKVDPVEFNFDKKVHFEIISNRPGANQLTANTVEPRLLNWIRSQLSAGNRNARKTK